MMRFVQIFIPDGSIEDVDSFCKDHIILGRWRDAQDEGRVVLHLLVPTDGAEKLMDQFEEIFGDNQDFHIILFPVEAVLPRLQTEEDPVEIGGEEKDETDSDKAGRVSREELYADVTDNLGINRVYLAMTILSSTVAAIGLMRNDLSILIGAMVIAPLLGPNVAMSLAVTLGDLSLLRRAVVTNLAGVFVALGMAIFAGLFIPMDLGVEAIVSRTRVHITDIFLALAAGSAGTFAFTRGLSGAVIGVMVAVALMPPLVAAGILFGAGEINIGLGALLLVLTNLVCVNLAGVATLLAQGVRPRTSKEEEVATNTSRVAVIAWLTLLVLLALILYFTEIGLHSTL